jgi:hypothetical protein
MHTHTDPPEEYEKTLNSTGYCAGKRYLGAHGRKTIDASERKVANDVAGVLKNKFNAVREIISIVMRLNIYSESHNNITFRQ